MMPKLTLIRRLAAVLLPAAAILAALPALPASASTGSLHETFGSWYVGAQGGSPQEGSVTKNVNAPGVTLIFANGPGGTGTIQSSAHTGLCLAPNSTSDLRIVFKLCNATGVRWSWVSAPTSHYFVNGSSAFNGLRLSGDSAAGDPLAACPAGGCNGNWTLQQWTGPS